MSPDLERTVGDELGMTKEPRMRDRTQQGETAGDLRPVVFVLFGATGDLASRMVLPAFYRLAQEGLLPEQWLLVGNGRGDISHEKFRAHVHDALTEFGPQPEPAEWDGIRAAGVLRRRRVQHRQSRQLARRPGASPARRWAATRSSSTTWPSRPSRSAG